MPRIGDSSSVATGTASSRLALDSQGGGGAERQVMLRVVVVGVLSLMRGDGCSSPRDGPTVVSSHQVLHTCMN